MATEFRLFFEGESWSNQARCAKLPETERNRLFFQTGVGDNSTDQKRVNRQAKAVCAECPAKDECLTKALVTNDIYLGVRGGLSTSQLRDERARRIRTGEMARPARQKPTHGVYKKSR